MAAEPAAAGPEMAPARVVRLANDIAAQFPAQTTEVAAKTIAAHISTFWEPRMTAALIFALAGPDSGLSPGAAAAARLLAASPG